jgi:hypothetical protein
MNVEQRLARLGELLQRVRERRDAPRHLEAMAAALPEAIQPGSESSVSVAPLAQESDVVVEVLSDVVEVDLDVGLEVEEPVFEAPIRTPPPESGEQEAVTAEPAASLDRLDTLDEEPSMPDDHTLVRGWAEGPAPLPTRPSHGRMSAVRVPAPVDPIKAVSTHPALADTDDVVEVMSMSDSGVAAPSTFGEWLDASLAL